MSRKLIRTYSTVEDGAVKVKDFKVMNPNITTATADISDEIMSLKSDEEGKNASMETTMEESIACNVSGNAKEVLDKCEDSFDGEITNVAETDTGLYKNINKNNNDLNIYQSICENSEKAQDTPTETLNASNALSSSACFNSKSSNDANEKDNPLT